MAITAAFGRYVTSMDCERIPSEVLAVARRAILDTVGCGIAGSREPAAKIARELGRQDGGVGRATVIGVNDGAGALRLPAQNAAMLNAVAGHALDYDDVNAMGHPSVPVVFAALAACQDTGASGRDLLTAYVAGVEVETKLMKAFTESHYLVGWHSTSTLGVFGAAAAAARLYRLTPEQTATAFGIAASQASGLRQNFGTMTKPFHPGHASWSGIIAARLARAGFTADQAIFEAPLGFLAVFAAGPYDPQRAVEKMETWALLRPGLSVKKYPCCYCTHASIDATLAVAARINLAPEDIVSIHAELSPFFLSPLIHHRPATGLEGKFSLEYALAAALLDRKVVLTTFTDAMVRRRAARDLVERVRMSAHDVPGEQGPHATFARLAFELRGGRRIVEEVAEPRGTAANPLSDDELAEKFRDCCRFAGKNAAQADAALGLLWQVDGLERVDELTEMLG